MDDVDAVIFFQFVVAQGDGRYVPQAAQHGVAERAGDITRPGLDQGYVDVRVKVADIPGAGGAAVTAADDDDPRRSPAGRAGAGREQPAAEGRARR